jgi:hypothetical protein
MLHGDSDFKKKYLKLKGEVPVVVICLLAAFHLTHDFRKRIKKLVNV